MVGGHCGQALYDSAFGSQSAGFVGLGHLAHFRWQVGYNYERYEGAFGDDIHILLDHSQHADFGLEGNDNL